MISQRLWGGLGGDASEGGRAESKGCDRRAGGGVRQERLGEATVKPLFTSEMGTNILHPFISFVLSF